MSHVPHELHEEFPGDLKLLHALKTGNAHFAKLADRYHEINRDIHRAEAGVQAMADDALETLKKQRLSLKDEIASMLAKV
jgi:uncharacterized protein YdcH (DUF465 family)